MDASDIARRTFKMLDIALCSTYYFFLVLVSSFILNQLFGAFDRQLYDNMTTAEVVLRTLVHGIAIALTAYLLRNIVNTIPFPLEGTAGYIHTFTKEVNGGVVLVVLAVAFQNSFLQKCRYVYSRFFGAA